MKFECKLNAERDESGRLQQISVTWLEARAMAEGAVDWLGDQVFMLGPATAVFGLIALPVDMKLGGLILSGVVSWVGFRIGRSSRRMKGRLRRIVFATSGVIESPLGLVHDGNTPVRWRNTWHEIVNFESELVRPPDKDGSVFYSHGVRAINREGDVLHIAASLHPDHAHKLATTLMIAMQAVRDEVAGGVPGRKRAKQFID